MLYNITLNPYTPPIHKNRPFDGMNLDIVITLPVNDNIFYETILKQVDGTLLIDMYVLRKVGIDTILEWLCAKSAFLLGCAK